MCRAYNNCLLSGNNRPGNKDVALSLPHVIGVVCSLSVRSDDPGYCPLGRRTEGSRERTLQSKKTQASVRAMVGHTKSYKWAGENIRRRNLRTQTLPLSHMQLCTKKLYCPCTGDSDISGWLTIEQLRKETYCWCPGGTFGPFVYLLSQTNCLKSRTHKTYLSTFNSWYLTCEIFLRLYSWLCFRIKAVILGDCVKYQKLLSVIVFAVHVRRVH